MGAGGSTPALRGAALGTQTLRSAAAWVADEMGPARELAAVCVDVTGGVCGWLSAPDASPSVVIAALQQQTTSMSSYTGESSAAPVTFGLLGDAPLGPGSDRSIEALAPFEASRSRGVLAKLTTKAAGDAPATRKRRLAVLSIPDAPVRVFLDELDRLKIDAGAVLSLWHTIAAAWDPGRPTRDGSRPDASTNGHSTVADSAQPVTATVLIEPSGRLLWSWSASGDLLAAGSMKLRVHHRVSSAAAASAGSGDAGTLALMDLEQHPSSPAEHGARRIAGTGTLDASGEQAVVDVSAAQIGRLTMDWLAWSAQLGLTPDRIVCMGADAEAISATGDPVSLAQSLAEAWPGATVDVVSHRDPIGATLSRVRMLPNLGAPQASPAAAGPDRPAARPAMNPQAGLVQLSGRAGRADRSLYRWVALGIALLAGAVFFGAYRLDRATRGAGDKLAQMKADRVDLLKTVDDVVPGISTRPSTALDELQGKLVQAREEMNKLKREPALLPEIVRVMTALNADPEKFEKLQIVQFELSTLVPGTLTMMVPYNDPVERDYPAEFWQSHLSKLPGAINWSSGDYQGPVVGDRRKYIFEGRWPAPASPPTGGTP